MRASESPFDFFFVARPGNALDRAPFADITPYLALPGHVFGTPEERAEKLRKEINKVLGRTSGHGKIPEHWKSTGLEEKR